MAPLELQDKLLDDNFSVLIPYIDSFYSYMDNVIDQGKIVKYYDKVKVKYVPTKNNIHKDKVLSFVVAIKNYSKSALLSIESLIRSIPGKNVEIIIVEDKSKNRLNLDRLSPCDRLKYYYIDTKEKDWNRSKVLNFGIRKSKGRYIVPWDGCMLCNSSFIGKLLDYIHPTELYIFP
jgi:hypothetical protein